MLNSRWRWSGTLRPEAVSLAIRELCPSGDQEEVAAQFFSDLVGLNVYPQYILYSAEDVRYFRALVASGVVPQKRPHVLFVLGRYSPDMTSTAQDLLPFMQEIEGMTLDWSVCAFGPLESACALTAAGLGGHCRVGFENNLLLSDGNVAPDNAALVSQVAIQAPAMGRQIASPEEARRLLAMG